LQGLNPQFYSYPADVVKFAADAIRPAR